MPLASERKRIAFLYQADPRDPRVQSGRPHSILKALIGAGHEVFFVTPPHWLMRTAQTPFAMLRWLRLWRGDTTRTPLVAVIFAILAKYATRTLRVDILFSTSTVPFRNLRNFPDVLRVACVDTLLPGFDAYYSNRPSHTADVAAEASCLRNIDILIVPTRWAASQVDELPIEKRVETIIAPFGANFIKEIDEQTYRLGFDKRLQDPVLRILLVSSDWSRKNGDRVLEIADLICGLGLDCAVHVIGNAIPQQITRKERGPASVHAHGYIDKATDAGHRKWLEIVGCCHFHLLISKGEAFGMSICETAALGVPSLVSNKGGLSSIVSDGVSGWILDEITNAAMHNAALRLFETKCDIAAYCAMSTAARQAYVDKLNWASFIKSTFDTSIMGAASRGCPRL